MTESQTQKAKELANEKYPVSMLSNDFIKERAACISPTPDAAAVENNEVERLKELINKMWHHDINTYYDHLFDDETCKYWYEKFKEINNL